MLKPVPQHSCPATASAYPYRIMVVDDSATVRGLVRTWAARVEDIEVVATCGNGLQALKSMRATKPEIILLDIDMPVMDGMTALPQMLKTQPGVKVIVASSLSTRSAAITLEALDLGAADYITKPSATQSMTSAVDYQRELFEKIRIFGEIIREERDEFLPVVKETVVDTSSQLEDALRTPHQKPDHAYAYQPVSDAQPEIIAIGASTGGPQALQHVLTELKGSSLPPVVVTQHMPKTFTALLAEHLTKAVGLECREATHGEILEAGKVYIAPGDYHMSFATNEGQVMTVISQTEQINFCRPSVDPMFGAVATLFGQRALAIMLTGMGRDGLNGTRAIINAGGSVIAQDEKTSVVWGMPGAIAEAGLCSYILPLTDIAEAIKTMLKGGE